jgi:hypothetical protein
LDGTVLPEGSRVSNLPDDGADHIDEKARGLIGPVRPEIVPYTIYMVRGFGSLCRILYTEIYP